MEDLDKRISHTESELSTSNARKPSELVCDKRAARRAFRTAKTEFSRRKSRAVRRRWKCVKIARFVAAENV